MRSFLWSLIARYVSRPDVAARIIARAQRTPYTPITSRDGAELYMDRWWLFNGYSKDAEGNERAPWPWLPSIRVHHILRADDDGAPHDHPWMARTIVLRGWYEEEREWLEGEERHPDSTRARYAYPDDLREVFVRRRGYTGPVRFQEYHRISEVSPGGVFTLWFTWRYQGTWGFKVNGKKVPWREHLK